MMVGMRLSEYRFGSLSIDGTSYAEDVIVVHDAVHSPWWREAGGHVFALGDLTLLLTARPEVVVLGTGFLGLVRVPSETLEGLQRSGCEVFVERTDRAVKLYNELAEQGRDVAAALHLTC